MINIIISIIIIAAVIASISYIVREKKKGRHCIGCPSAGSCNKRNCECQSNKK